MEETEDESENYNKEQNDKSISGHAFAEQQRHLDAEAITGCISLD